MTSPERAPSPAPEALLAAAAAAGLSLSPPGGGDREAPPGASPEDPGGVQTPPAPLEQELAALGLPPGGGRRALEGLLRLYREAAAGGARRERELRRLRERLGVLQDHVVACAGAMAASRDEAERLREQNRRLWALLMVQWVQGQRPTAPPGNSSAPRRPRQTAAETRSSVPRGGARAAARTLRTTQRQPGARRGPQPPPASSRPPRAPSRDPDVEQELQRLQGEVAAGREVIALQHRCLQEAALAALAAPGPPPGLAEERGRLRRLQGALARERRAFTEAAERLAREWEQFEAERASLLQQHFLSVPDPWDAPEMWGGPAEVLWSPPQLRGGSSALGGDPEPGGDSDLWGSPEPQP